MRVLIDDGWRGGFLDYWCGPGEHRIEVRRWVIVEQLRDLFIEQSYDLRRLIDYGREIGPVEVARKVMSRLSESHRNEKVAAAGLGVDLATGEPVAFFAPCVPRCVERVVVPPQLCWPAPSVPDMLEFAIALDQRFAAWSGWTRESGRAFVRLRELETLVREVVEDAHATDIFPIDLTPVMERRGEPVEGSRLKASVFGYGHYVRTIVMPSIPAEIEVVTVHELDPVLAPDCFPAVDTSPHFRDDEHPDIAFVAGYHHTHAPHAAEALRRDSAVVIEKPLATTPAQLDDLLAAWSASSRCFAGFQRRFIAANRWISKDLSPTVDNPLSYHALVHEVSLPARHWYNWPRSGSRLLSNGCHWIDHFLWLNDFVDVVDKRAHRGPNDEIVVELTLENGAYFTLTLTDRGSDRLGVREHTELRVRDRTAVIEDGNSYRSEGPRGVIRRERFHRLAAHREMYETFARRIVAGEPGDSRRSIEQSARVALDLEAMLHE